MEFKDISQKRHSFVSFRLVEICLFILMLIFSLYIIFRSITNTFPYPPMPFICGLFILYFLFIIEHKNQIIFDRKINKILFMEKALFQNKYKCTETYTLSDVEKAVLITERDEQAENTEMYHVELKCKNDENLDLLNMANSNRAFWENIEIGINNFLSSVEEIYCINNNSCVFRIVSIIIMLPTLIFLCINLFSTLIKI